MKSATKNASQKDEIDELFFRQVVGERIRSLREDRKMKQRQLGDAAGIDKFRMCRIENGHLTLNAVQAARIAKALGVSNDDLLRVGEENAN